MCQQHGGKGVNVSTSVWKFSPPLHSLVVFVIHSLVVFVIHFSCSCLFVPPPPSMSLLEWAVIQFANVFSLGNHILAFCFQARPYTKIYVCLFLERQAVSVKPLREHWSFLLIHQKGKPSRANKINFQVQISSNFWMGSKGVMGLWIGLETENGSTDLGGKEI